MNDTGYAEVDGARLFYEVAGQGRPLVLIHAGIADGRMWDDQLGAFARRYRVIRYDRRGFGKSAMVAGTYSHHRDLHGLLAALGVREATLVGCSQGAKTALDFTLEHPAMTAAMVLASPAISGFRFEGPTPPQAAQIDLAEEAGDLDLVNELELQVWVDGQHRAPGQVDPDVREKVRAMNLIALQTPADLGEEQPLEPSAADRLGEVRAPTLVISGNIDTPKTRAAAAYLAEGIVGAREVVMTGVAHMPNMESPTEFNRRVLEFLSAAYN